jgi:hypothetical protein
MRGCDGGQPARKRRKRLNVEPGRSIQATDENNNENNPDINDDGDDEPEIILDNAEIDVYDDSVEIDVSEINAALGSDGVNFEVNVDDDLRSSIPTSPIQDDDIELPGPSFQSEADQIDSARADRNIFDIIVDQSLLNYLGEL